MNARIERAKRIVDLARERVDVARAQLADARRLVVEAHAEVERCELEWRAAASMHAPPVTAAFELERQSEHLRTLRLRADSAGRCATDCVSAEHRADAAVVDAVKQRRKLELWCERMTRDDQEAHSRLNARAEDELAARTVRQRL